MHLTAVHSTTLCVQSVHVHVYVLYVHVHVHVYMYMYDYKDVTYKVEGLEIPEEISGTSGIRTQYIPSAVQADQRSYHEATEIPSYSIMIIM